MELGKAIKLIRNSKGLKQEEVAKKASLTHSYISKIELGQRDPVVSTLVKVAQALGVTVASIFILAETKDPSVLFLISSYIFGEEKE